MPQIIAFDIDGALTEPSGIQKFREVSKRRDVVAGIISARSKRSTTEFVQETNLDPEFTIATPFKGMQMRKLSRELGGRDNVYYGSWLRDRLHTSVAGWEYKQL